MKRKTSKIGCLLFPFVLTYDLFIKPLMKWDGFTTSVTRKRRRKKR